MPLFWIDSFSPAGAVAVWSIREEADELSFHAGDMIAPDEVVHPRKRQEWLAGRSAARVLAQRFRLPEISIDKDEFGKPYIRDSPTALSLTHSFPYAAAILHRNESVGIDLEQPSEKILKIRSRFMSPAELEDAADSIPKLTLYWCAKEALYKWWGKRGIHFSTELYVSPFAMDETGDLPAQVRKETRVFSVPLYYRVFPDFVMVYTKPA